MPFPSILVPHPIPCCAGISKFIVGFHRIFFFPFFSLAFPFRMILLLPHVLASFPFFLEIHPSGGPLSSPPSFFTPLPQIHPLPTIFSACCSYAMSFSRTDPFFFSHPLNTRMSPPPVPCQTTRRVPNSFTAPPFPGHPPQRNPPIFRDFVSPFFFHGVCQKPCPPSPMSHTLFFQSGSCVFCFTLPFDLLFSAVAPPHLSFLYVSQGNQQYFFLKNHCGPPANSLAAWNFLSLVF